MFWEGCPALRAWVGTLTCVPKEQSLWASLLYSPVPAVGPGDPFPVRLGLGDGQPFLIPVPCAGAWKARTVGATVSAELWGGVGRLHSPFPWTEEVVAAF